jgi:hypothetical protein
VQLLPCRNEPQSLADVERLGHSFFEQSTTSRTDRRPSVGEKLGFGPAGGDEDKEALLSAAPADNYTYLEHIKSQWEAVDRRNVDAAVCAFRWGAGAQ